VVHAGANSLRRHKTIPAYKASSPVPTCTVHLSSQLAYYCLTDKTPLCADCIIQSHKEHSIVPIEEAVSLHCMYIYYALRMACDDEACCSAHHARRYHMAGAVAVVASWTCQSG
jgi:hypothetical protein